METVTDFILGGLQNHSDGDYSHEIKRCLLLGRKAMTNLDSILKTGTLLYQQMSIQSNYGFLVVIYGCESWTKRKLGAKELVVLNCGVGKDSCKSLRLQGDPTSPP